MAYGYGGYSRKRKGQSKSTKSLWREENKFPKRFFGRAYYKRGIPGSVSMNRYGASRGLATQEQLLNRKNEHFSGSGGYWGQRAGDWLSGATGFQGLGAMGSNLENQVINKGVKFLSGYTGSGAYTENNALVNPEAGNVPTITSSGLDTADITVSNKEYIGDILGTLPFTNTSYMLNPGNALVFPWLSQLAVNFEEFNFNQLIFGFKSVTPDSVVGTTQVGSVIMCANYNSSSANFASKIPMMEYDGAVSGKITENVIFGVECDDSKNASISGTMYVCSGSVPTGQDPKMYFLANMQIAINQAALTGQIGELWVTYNCTLKKKKLWSYYGNHLPVFSVQAVNASGLNLNIGNMASGSKITSTLWSPVSSGQQSANYYYSSTLTTPAQCRAYGISINPAFASQFSFFCLSASGSSNLLGFAGCTGCLIVFYPDSFTGVAQMQLSFNGNSTTLGAAGAIGLATSTNGGFNQFQYTAAGNGAVPNMPAMFNAFQSGVTAGLTGATGSGTWGAFTFISTYATIASFSLAQISALA